MLGQRGQPATPGQRGQPAMLGQGLTLKCHRVVWVSLGKERLKGKKSVRQKKGLKGSILECPLGRLYTCFIERRSLTCYHVTPRMYAVLSQNRLEWNVQKGMVSSKGWSIQSGPYERSHAAHLTTHCCKMAPSMYKQAYSKKVCWCCTQKSSIILSV